MKSKVKKTSNHSSTADLKVDEAGTLPRPGPVGRLFRLSMALVCVWVVYELLENRGAIFEGSPLVFGRLSVMIGAALYLSSYVVNIGYLVSLKRRPMYVLCAAYVISGAYGYWLTGSPWAAPLGFTVFSTMLYLYSHLGISFLLAAVFATPGCEMRAIAHVLALFTGRDALEHCCPIGPLQPLDRWEARQTWYRG